MKKNIIYIIGSLSIIAIFAWIEFGSSSTPLKDKTLSKKEHNIDSLALVYNASVVLNNLELNTEYYTAQLQEKPITGLQIVDRFLLEDIVKKEGQYFLIATSYRNLLRYELKINSSQFVELTNKKKKINLYNYCILNADKMDLISTCYDEGEERWVYGSLDKLID